MVPFLTDAAGALRSHMICDACPACAHDVTARFTNHNICDSGGKPWPNCINLSGSEQLMVNCSRRHNHAGPGSWCPSTRAPAAGVRPHGPRQLVSTRASAAGVRPHGSIDRSSMSLDHGRRREQ